MALQFPPNPSIGQTYQTGSLPTYRYTGQIWRVDTPTTDTVVFTQTSSYAPKAGVIELVSNTISASLAQTASFIPGLVIPNPVATASYAHTASAVLSPSRQLPIDGGVVIAKYKQDSQPISEGVETSLNDFEAVVLRNGGFDNTTGEFEASQTGVYLVRAQVCFNRVSSIVSNRGKGTTLRLKKNDGTAHSISQASFNAQQDSPPRPGVMIYPISLQQGDRLGLSIEHDIPNRQITARGSVDIDYTTFQIKQIN